jgi:CRISPR-associated protein Cmr5
MPKTLDQRRARHAWDVVQRAGKLDKPQKKDFGSELKKMPARIIASGLGQALVFLEARRERKPGVSLLLDALDEWAAKMRKPTGPQMRLLHRIVQGEGQGEGDSMFLRWATAESLAYLQWLGRLAEAEGIREEED